jgi:hypothetical protein
MIVSTYRGINDRRRDGIGRMEGSICIYAMGVPELPQNYA